MSLGEILSSFVYTIDTFHLLCELTSAQFRGEGDRMSRIYRKIEPNNCFAMHTEDEMIFCMIFCNIQCSPLSVCNNNKSGIEEIIQDKQLHNNENAKILQLNTHKF